LGRFLEDWKNNVRPYKQNGFVGIGTQRYIFKFFVWSPDL